MLQSGEGLPEGVDLKGKFIYYVGPVDAVGDEVRKWQVQRPRREWTNSRT